MIELYYVLEKEDLLNLHLYAASKNPQVKKFRWIGRSIIAALLLFIGVLFMESYIYITYAFLVLAILAFFIYPKYAGWFQLKQLRKMVNEHYDISIMDFSLRMGDEVMELSGKQGSSSVNLKELLKIIETKDYFFLQQTKQVYFIIPKNKVAYTEELKSHLHHCSTTLHVPYSLDLNWK